MRLFIVLKLYKPIIERPEASNGILMFIKNEKQVGFCDPESQVPVLFSCEGRHQMKLFMFRDKLHNVHAQTKNGTKRIFMKRLMMLIIKKNAKHHLGGGGVFNGLD
jgi:hypothetical protein